MEAHSILLLYSSCGPLLHRLINGNLFDKTIFAAQSCETVAPVSFHLKFYIQMKYSLTFHPLFSVSVIIFFGSPRGTTKLNNKSTHFFLLADHRVLTDF